MKTTATTRAAMFAPLDQEHERHSASPLRPNPSSHVPQSRPM
jgi:hypothetical protein